MNRLRPSLARLHNLAGLGLGWLLFVMFVTGSCGYYRHEITLWMTPELRPLLGVNVPQPEAARRAADWLSANASTAARWSILLPDEKSPALRVSWSGEVSGEQVLDPRDGRPLSPAPRETGGGDFLYRIHSDLHFVPAIVGRFIVSLVGVWLLVLLVSGLVAHRHILQNLFRFRRGHGWRTHLDLHNLFGVLGLPFHLFIACTGLVTVMMLMFPWGTVSVFGTGGLGQFAQEAFPGPIRTARSPDDAVPASLEASIAVAQSHWQSAAVGEITVENPGAVGARITIAHSIRNVLAMRKPAITFEAVSGRVIGTTNERLSSASLFHSQVFGLHVAHFADPLVRLLLFVLGIVGAMMTATGMTLWVAKRHVLRSVDANPRVTHRSAAMVSRLNAGILAGLPIAIAAYLWSSRWVPAAAPDRIGVEQDVMFVAWGVTIAAAFILPARRLWTVLLAAGGVMLAGAAVADLTLPYPAVTGVDAGLLVVAALLIGLAGRAAMAAGHAGR